MAMADKAVADKATKFILLVISIVALLRPLLIQQIDGEVRDICSFIHWGSAGLIVICEVIASTTFTALVSQYTIESFGSKSNTVMRIAWVANMALDGFKSFLHVPKGQEYALSLVSFTWPVFTFSWPVFTFISLTISLIIYASPPKYFKFEMGKIALMMAICDSATSLIQRETANSKWKKIFTYCQLVGKLISIPIVYLAMTKMSSADKKTFADLTKELRHKIISWLTPVVKAPLSPLVVLKSVLHFVIYERSPKLLVAVAQLGRTFAYATFICLAGARTTSASWWGPVILPLNVLIPSVGVHLAAPIWLWLLDTDSPTIELLTRTITKTTGFGLCLILIGYYIPFIQGHTMAIAVTCLVSTDLLFDQLMTLLELDAGQIALQKTFDSLLLPIMTIVLGLNSRIGTNIETGNKQYADKAIGSFNSILLVTISISLVALYRLWKTKKD